MPSPDTGGEAERFFSCGGGSGRYTVMVNAEGYEPWESDVRVGKDGCHPDTEQVYVELTPL